MTRLHAPARGFAVLEALIALLIFSLAVLGLVGLQASMTKATSGAKYRADAAYLASDLVGTMWADARNLASYGNCSQYPACSSWQARVSSGLPGGTGQATILDATAGQVTVRVSWQAPSEDRHVFETTTSINANPSTP